MMARRTGFYLDKRNGKVMGVCAGIADYTGFDVLWVRIGFVLATLFGFPFPLIAYFVIGWMADAKPNTLYVDDADPEEREFWQKTRAAPGRSIREVRSTFRDVDRRLRDIELTYTSPNHRLAREIDELR
ncbi:envelope stress response membrane protein PspC [Sandaracinobacter sp. RS1-74]|uniref:envelope stress response membrane protein PspC n=1 Tax=Sandaracinobacteroides sayramensis TaxID=2913411 RepID=UPI001EDA608E|nr:envelope stress response membrane protein PspC [Sandaracinobacteroides sayramensis]